MLLVLLSPSPMSVVIGDTSAQKHMLSTGNVPFIHCRSPPSTSIDMQAMLKLSSISSLLSFMAAFAVVPDDYKPQDWLLKNQLVTMF